MNQPAMVIPEGMQALLALGKASMKSGVSRRLLDLVNLRASQINGCSYCVDMHARDPKQAGETDERLWGVAAWRESPHFSEAERAALALTEAATRLADRSDPIDDDVWNEAARRFDERQLAGLLLGIALINTWNRLNVATRQVAGSHREAARRAAQAVAG
ncbi:MAG TPA: carboxymuconolactone decarboxylase family protein [Caulobacteraceae bacterium]|nr:carboxymuconolactone decarboxylase family protein [Caulobacteraceae bacterium]